MAELNQNKTQNNWLKLIFRNTVTYSIKQLFIIAPQICCTKGIENFPRELPMLVFFPNIQHTLF